MINLIYSPQRADYKAEYSIVGDVLTVKIGDKTETFNFTGLPDGQAEEISTEVLEINPIVSVKKADDVVDVTVIRFYTFEEKELFENGEN